MTSTDSHPLHSARNHKLTRKTSFQVSFAEPLDLFNLLLIGLSSELVDFSASPLPSYTVRLYLHHPCLGTNSKPTVTQEFICLRLREVGASAPSNLRLLQPKPLHCVLSSLESCIQLSLSFIIFFLVLRFIPTGLFNPCTSLPLSE